MPYLNDLGEWCAGIANVGVYWQGGTIWPAGQGGGAQWLNDDEVIGQKTGGLGPDEPVGLYAHHVRTGKDRLLFAGGVHFVGGSGHGHWVIRTVDGGVSVVRDSIGRALVDAGIGDGAMGPDGSYVVKRKYHSAGPFDVYEPDGSRRLLTNEDVFDLVNYGQRRLTWTAPDGTWLALGVPVPQPLTTPVYSFRYVFIGSELWQLYQLPDWRLVCHQHGDPNGYVLHTGETHRPDASRLVDGRVRLVWSVQQGDPSHAIRTHDLDLSEARTDLTPTDPPVELPPLESVPLLNRPFGLAVYRFNGASLDGLGNISLPIRPTEDDAIDPPVILPADPWFGDEADLFAVYSGETKDLTAEDFIALRRPLAQRLRLGLAIHQDSFPMRDSVLALVEAHDLVFPMVYREPNESSADFRARLRLEYLRVDRALPPGAECWPIVNLHLRKDEHGPTLSGAEVVDTLVTAFQLADELDMPGLVIFRLWPLLDPRDMAVEALPYIQRFLSGITAVPETRVIPKDPEQPEEPDMADRVYIEDPTAPTNKAIRLIPKVLKELDKGNDNLALQLEDGKLLSVLPDGTFTFDATSAGAYQLFKIAKNNASQYIVERDSRVYRFGRLVEA